MKQRRVDLDAMRVIAIALVLLNHLPAYTLYNIGSGGGTLSEIGYLVTAILTRINVPLFAMVSGALLLGREETLGEVWQKRIKRMLLVIVIFQTSLFLQRGWMSGSVLDWKELVRELLESGHRGYVPYWFLYAYTGFLLMLPYLRRIARTFTKQDFWYLMGLHFLISTLPILCNFMLALMGEDTFALSGHLRMPLTCTGLLFYPLMGYYLDKKMDVREITTQQWCLLFGASVICITICGSLTYWQGVTGKFTQQYLDVFTYINTPVVFLSIKHWFTSRQTRTATSCDMQSCETTQPSSILSVIICQFGMLSFGIYLLDNNLKEALWIPFAKSMLPHLSKYMMSWVWVIMSMAICGTATWLLRKLPFFKKLL